MYPILFATPWFNVYTYGLLVALGYTLGAILALKQAKQEKLNSDAVFDLLLLQLVIGVAGSRLLYLLEYDSARLSLGSFFAFEQGGLTFYGAVISSIIFNLLYLKYLKMPFWQVIDCIGYGLPAGIAVARLGCLFNGCCYGTRTSLPWGLHFAGAGAEACHPTQIYEALGALLIWFLLRWLRPKRRNYGELFLACMAAYAALRFVLEPLRAENPVWFLGMTSAQWIAGVMLAAALGGWQKIKAGHSQRIIPGQELIRLSDGS